MSEVQQNAKPDWACRHPFPPDRKRPALLGCTTIARIYGRAPHRIATWMHLSTDLLTHAEFALAPGKHFEPADIHAGDEVYYVLAGTPWVHQPSTGQVIRLEPGDALHIPMGAPHVSYAVGGAECRVLTFFAPRIWAEREDALVVPESLPGRVVTPGRGGWDGRPPGGDTRPPFPVSARGQFPVDGPWSREHGILTAVAAGRAALFIHGREEPLPLRIFIDNDVMALGTMSLAAGTQSDPESHPGDEVVRVLEGDVSIEVESRSRKSVSVLRLDVPCGERALLPVGVEHRYLNFGPRPAEILFAVAPRFGWGTEA